MKNRPKIYEMKMKPVKPEDDSGVFAISLVDRPAIQQDFVLLSKDNKPLLHSFSVNQYEKLLTGPVLIPDIEILRTREGSEPNTKEIFYNVISADTIKQVRDKFFDNMLTKSIRHQHEKSLYNFNVVESWIKRSDVDMSNELGYNLPNGTWFVSVKINNDRYWNDEILTGNVKGFSIEGYFDDILINQSENKNLKKFMIELNSEIVTNTGTILIVDDNYKVTLSDKSPAPDSIYILDDGTELVVLEGYLTDICLNTPASSSDGMATMYSKQEPKMLAYTNDKKKAKRQKKSLIDVIIDRVMSLNKKFSEEKKFMEVTAVDGTVINVDDTTMKVDVKDAQGTIIGYLQYFPAEATVQSQDPLPAPNSTAAEVAMKSQLEETNNEVKLLRQQFEDLTNLISKANPKPVTTEKKDFTKVDDSRSSLDILKTFKK
ncbi:hypothetical protein EKK58_11310 [Candidatus Dependentiae bacterium]|nr:MAG: hypothetical protein EKK58_11310 [Candidatus Dependentiae bacterium]